MLRCSRRHLLRPGRPRYPSEAGSDAWSLLPSDFPSASAVKYYFDEQDAGDDPADPAAHDSGEGLAAHDARGNCDQGEAG